MHPHPRLPWPRALAPILLTALALRAVLLYPALAHSTLDDPDNYLPLARSIADGQGLSFNGRPTAYRPPLYPLLLAPIVVVLGDRASLGVAALHVTLGAATVLLTAAAARRWGLSPSATLAAAAIVGLDPVLAAQARSVMTETLAASLVAAGLFAWTFPRRSGPLVAGVVFGLGALCRPSLLPAALLTSLAPLFSGAAPFSARFRRTGLVLVGLAAALAPWALRNVRAVGAPVVATTHGGYTLFLANNPVYYREVVNGPPGAVWSGPNQRAWFESIEVLTGDRPEPQADRVLRDEALRVIARQPADFVRASLARLGRFWGLAPAGSVYPRPLRVATTLWTLPLWIALACGLARRDAWTWPRIAAPLAILGLTAVHAFYWTDLRMRAPIVPAVALVAAASFRPRNAAADPHARNR